MLRLMGSQSQTLHSSLILLTVKKIKVETLCHRLCISKVKGVSEDVSVELSHLAGLALKSSWVFLLRTCVKLATLRQSFLLFNLNID